MDHQIVISYINKIPLLIALLLVARNYLRFSVELKVISWYVFLSVIVQFSSQYLASQKINNMYLLHIFVPTSFVCLSMFYQKTYASFLNRKIIWWIVSLFVVYSVFNSMYWEDIKTFNSYALSVESVLLIIYSLSLFALLLNEEVRNEKRELLSSLRWINSGILIYYASGLLIFYFGDFLTRFSFEKFQISWLFHSFIYIVQFTCISIGLWKYQKK
ncbi:hypothetical protein [uncultured Kordia sp.]|uniref:hypothetical protein n=1 Tax=uncultured Kordia sp. TaxID=507699 RepID=UPI002623423C|nr:hypothetical protein [uncultured Kordia sp.]